MRAGKWAHIGEEALKDVESIVIIEQFLKAESTQSIHIEELKQLNEQLKMKLGEWRQKLYEINQDLTGISKERDVLANEVENLKKGRKSIPEGVQKLQRILQAEFGEVPMLCDLIEIKDPKWQNAIEGYLHLQKFYLIVNPENFEAALKRYEEVKARERIYDVGLVDLKKVRDHHRGPKPGSLAEVVMTENDHVRYYVDYLLGSVIKVDSVKELRQHRTSITSSCMLYKNFVARNLNPKRYEVPFIGKSAVVKQLQLKEERLQEAVEALR